MGAEVAAVTRNRKKEEDASKLGADYVIATDEEGWETKHAGKFDLIVSTVDSQTQPLTNYLNLVKYFGYYVQVGAPEGDMPGFNAFKLFLKNIKLTGTMVGSRKDIKDMLTLVNEHKEIKTWANLYPMSQVNEALKAFNRGEQRYRLVLINEKHANK